jgi:hypothetical protein
MASAMVSESAKEAPTNLRRDDEPASTGGFTIPFVPFRAFREVTAWRSILSWAKEA